MLKNILWMVGGFGLGAILLAAVYMAKLKKQKAESEAKLAAQKKYYDSLMNGTASPIPEQPAPTLPDAQQGYQSANA